MGALLGLVLGIGLLLIWQGATAPRSGPSPSLDVVSRRRRELIRQAGVDGVGSAQLWGAQLISALLAGALVLLITSTPAIAVAFAVFAFFVPVVVLLRLRRRRQTVLRELWPEAIDNLASAVRAGMSLAEGLGALALRGPEPLRAPFGRFAAAYRATGRFGECLDGLRDDLADPVGDRVCETVRVAREVGGSDLGTVLRALSDLLRSDARIRAELETRQGWVVNAARLAVAAPWVVLLLLGSQGTTLQSFDSIGGVLLLAIGGVVCLVAYRIMLRIGRLPQQRRVLHRPASALPGIGIGS